ncbi:DUF1178 family protein [Pseudodonghicola xiamenensis]|uniref:DUF1178 family protein n=1 Tax=Pseudodonghicola xiamenensis TaxID=337702 RepID=A0A8J3MEZ9_9RHOB|nr:DUF1178 family protein [Pseudodonghicola xiamenensis]GHH01017.1 hypothetical protein GCM10010961_38020 [Pseudodonghicola xiamenensis]
MIRYSLKCAEGHAFDSWFQSADAYTKLAGAGMVNCAVCGSPQVEKALMAPQVQHGRETEPATAEHPLAAPASAAEQALAELKRKIEGNSEYVGMNFAAEARAMHEGDAPERAIYGEAKAEEARALIEDGVPVTPLPFLPNRKTN